MARDFGVKYQVEFFEGYVDIDGVYGEIEITNEVVDYNPIIYAIEGEIGGMDECKLYIHPDSYHIFDPQVGDLVVKAGNIRLLDKIGTIGHITKDKQVYLEADYHDDGGAHEGSLVHITASSKVKIIQRNNKPFFWPMEDKLNETN